jgi:hypothetical protein
MPNRREFSGDDKMPSACTRILVEEAAPEWPE